MREALARSNLDLILAEEAAQPTPRPRKPRGAAAAKPAKPARSTAPPPQRLWFFRSRLAKRPLRTIAVASFGALLFGILVNAVALQKGRHPAPLFEPPAKVVRKRSPARPAPPARAAANPSPAPAAGPAPRSPAAAPAKPRPAARVEDPLGAFIAKEAADVAPVHRIYSAQRALRRLGFAVKASGKMDAATKAALARFERERGLPATGELGPRIDRVLAARSGVRIH